MTKKKNGNSKQIKLHEERGRTSVFINAEITHDGGLVVAGQEIGDAPRKRWGNERYEYQVSIPANQKDHVLLALLQALYTDNPAAVTEFNEFLQTQEIEHRFDSWT